MAMIFADVIDMQRHPHPETHPNHWAVQFSVHWGTHERKFWRWYRSIDAEAPSREEAIARFWQDTFTELSGFQLGVI